MMQIHLSFVPDYLKPSELYKYTIENRDKDDYDNTDDIIIEVAEKYYKPSININNLQNLFHLLHTLRFWMVNYEDLPYQHIFDFAIQNRNKTNVFPKIQELFYDMQIAYEFNLLISWPVIDDVCIYAAENGYLLLLKYLVERKYPISNGAIKIAAYKGHIKCIDYLANHGISLQDHDLCISAIRGDQPECLKYLLDKGCLHDEWLCNISAHYGKLECLRCLHKSGLSLQCVRITECAISAGQYKCLVYIHENGGCAFQEIIFKITGKEKPGHVKCLEYICKNGYILGEDDTLRMATNGHLECLIYMIENSCSLHPLTVARAAENGHLHCLKYLHKYEGWSTLISMYAARGGHIDCLQYLFDTGCPFNDIVTAAAAEYGKLTCLKYLHFIECPWSVMTSIAAAENGQLDCLKYLYENGCPCNEYTAEHARPHPKCLEYLMQNGINYINHNKTYEDDDTLDFDDLSDLSTLDVEDFGGFVDEE
jgi:hypothetical protein